MKKKSDEERAIDVIGKRAQCGLCGRYVPVDAKGILKPHTRVSARRVANLAAKLFITQLAPLHDNIEGRLRGVILDGHMPAVVELAKASIAHNELRLRYATALEKLPVLR